jgi:antitoxin component of MazEF toxin-antitoxin module
MYLKTVRVTNAKNMVLQIPCTVVSDWGLQKGDTVEVRLSEDKQEVVVKPRKGHVKISIGESVER